MYPYFKFCDETKILIKLDLHLCKRSPLSFILKKNFKYSYIIKVVTEIHKHYNERFFFQTIRVIAMQTERERQAKTNEKAEYEKPPAMHAF